jgi:hypothetical protein
MKRINAKQLEKLMARCLKRYLKTIELMNIIVNFAADLRNFQQVCRKHTVIVSLAF